MISALNIKKSDSRFVAAPVELKLARDGAAKGTVVGYGSVFGNQDLHGDIVEPGAFTDSIRRHATEKSRPLMLWQHDQREPVGVWDSFQEDKVGLRMTGRLNLETKRGQEAHSLLKQGALNGLSIGFLIPSGGADIDRVSGVRHLRQLDLWEVSLVTFPSNGKARIEGVKSVDNRTDFERFLRANGFAKAASRKLAAGGWPALQSTRGEELGGLLEHVKSATADLKRNTK